MRRWNGWGDDSFEHALPQQAEQLLRERIGEGRVQHAASLQEVLARVPESRLKPHPLIVTEADDRLLHARGQSLPDWVALRSGQIGTFPDGAAYPLTGDDVRDLLRYARETGTRLIPYGGGTSVVGHINPLPGDSPVLTVDMSRMNRLVRLDTHSHLAVFGAGISGPLIEAQLRAHGFTLGHFPQSFEYATLGGWIATRSSGQQSLQYGRIERLFAGGRVESPAGTLELPLHPASAAGPDLREMLLGSEGRMGFITEAAVRISRQPEREVFRAIFFPTFEHGQTAVRQLVQAGLPLSMLRLSTSTETETTLRLAGHTRSINALEKLLALRGLREEKSMLLFGYSGPEKLASATLSAVYAITGKNKGVHLRVGEIFGRQWFKARFRTPYLRNTLWDRGYAVDTLETAVPWGSVSPVIEAIESALYGALQPVDERVHVFTHISHVYPYGASIYTSYIFRVMPDPAQTLAHWQRLKAAASAAVTEQGGTISHQHGVGLDHKPYLAAEKGPLGMDVLRDLCRQFDPPGLMNPGKLLPDNR